LDDDDDGCLLLVVVAFLLGDNLLFPGIATIDLARVMSSCWCAAAAADA
jgi:hypothetical protein